MPFTLEQIGARLMEEPWEKKDESKRTEPYTMLKQAKSEDRTTDPYTMLQQAKSSPKQPITQPIAETDPYGPISRGGIFKSFLSRIMKEPGVASYENEHPQSESPLLNQSPSIEQLFKMLLFPERSPSPNYQQEPSCLQEKNQEGNGESGLLKILSLLLQMR